MVFFEARGFGRLARGRQRFLCLCFALLCFSVFSALAPALSQEDPGNTVEIRSARYNDYTRLVVPLPVDAPYSAEVVSGILTVSFGTVFTPDTSSLDTIELGLISVPVFSPSQEGTRMSLTLPSGAVVEDFKSGAFVIFDIYASAVEGGAEGAPEAGEAGQRGPYIVGGDAKERAAIAASVGAENPVQGDLSRQGAITSLSEEVDRQVQERLSGRQGQQEKIQFVVIGDEVREEEEQVVAPDLFEVPNGIQLAFAFEAETAAAVFERGPNIWIVFDRAVGFDGRLLREKADLTAQRVRSLTVEPNPDALVLRLSVRAGQFTTVERRGFDWFVSLKDARTRPRSPLVPTRRISAAGGQQVFISASDIGRKLTLTDAILGDEMVVLPIQSPGSGVLEAYEYALAEVLATSQGVVVVPLTDGVAVERFREGIVISDEAEIYQAGSGSAQEGDLSDNLRLVNFAAWRQGNEKGYRDAKKVLLYRLSIAEQVDRNQARWNLARFYVAYRRGPEALALLNLMLEEEPILERQPDFRITRAIANYFSWRYEEALTDLNIQALNSEQDAEIWKTLVTAKQGKYTQVLEHYRQAKDVLGNYDDEERADFTLDVIMAALATDDLPLAARELDLLDPIRLTPTQQALEAYFKARLNELEGNSELAEAQYRELSRSSSRRVSAFARWARAGIRYNNGELDAATFVDSLEQLRFAWRGDRFELTILLQIADIYVEAGLFAQSMDTLKTMTELYPAEAKELRLSQRMQALFRDLFVGAFAENLTPIEGISLFKRYQEFTPPGVEGDAMIRRLSDRLVSVDLLDQAADLLDYQVRERLEGVARAQIASNLAKIYILARRPEKSMEILRATREPGLPEDVEAGRRYVEARTLMVMERFEEAEVMLLGDQSAQAERIRADIYWGAKEYGKLVPSLERLITGASLTDGLLSEKTRFDLMRLTLALTFLSDQEKLIDLRRRYGAQMQTGDFSTSFDLLTNEQQLSGRELGVIAAQIAGVEQLQSFMRDYRDDFSG